MSFTPMNTSEAQNVRAAKKQASAMLADSFFTFSFAFVLCVLPCFAVFSLSGLVSLFLHNDIFLCLFFPLSCAFALRGYKAFTDEFFKTGKRRFCIIYEAAFDRPLKFLLRAAMTLISIILPASLIYSLPYLLNGSTSFHIICELLVAFSVLSGLCLSVSKSVFGDFSPKHLRFISSFLFQLLLSCLTKGAWLIILVPHLLLSGLIYSKPN